ncbi:MUTS-like protein [Artemisia annua]|uniref:MUTS-like protein n=1 Tax=Artemisia annua TaxID=35608 RepID=A0A2U1KHL6_ARTAN|nr:MUTS-like protein [Artemisia annua]
MEENEIGYLEKTSFHNTKCIKTGFAVESRCFYTLKDTVFRFILLACLNMGGKSTLLRQVCLAVILAQSSATHRSLVALDELGRATTTSDGHAVSLCHMARRVGDGVGGLEEVTFLYKLTLGTCPTSHGVNIASLAVLLYAIYNDVSEKHNTSKCTTGLPDNLLQKAATKLEEFETMYDTRCGSLADGIFDLHNMEKILLDQEPNGAYSTGFRPITHQVPWSHERLLENKELNAIIGA